MSIETAKRFANLLETKDLNGLKDIFTDDFTAKGPTMELTKEQTIGYLQMLFTAFPDMSFGLSDFEEKWNQVTCVSHERGTHKGTLDLSPFDMPVSLPPTGKAFKLSESVYTIRVAGDKVVYFSEEVVEGSGLAGILKQLGVELP